ncbi:MAG: dihydrofolate reductase, partial [Bacteroidetes bacterium]|nr:dihydrofolate reductase [Bacteroidota bacterium]
MKNHSLFTFILGFFILIGCAGDPATQAETEVSHDENFVYKVDQFADLKILRYQVPGFEQLPLKQKQLLYYLYKASLAGRDIIYDQNFKYNLAIRRTLEAIVNSGKKDESGDYENFMVYAKRVWFSNGIHHHYSQDKIQPEFSQEYFAELVNSADPNQLPLKEGQSVDDFLAEISPIIFDPSIAAKKVNLASDIDHVTKSAVNFYEGVTEAEVDAYYEGIIDKTDEEPISYGLNTKVVKEN